MNKKLLALAVAAALVPAAAMADSGNVNIYGVMDASYDITNNGDSAAGAKGIRTNKVSSNNGRIGFKGNEDLGNGTSAIWQVESTLFVDQGAGTLGTRNTFVGLSSKSWGTALLGRHDTPYKLATRSLDYFTDGLADTRNIMGGGAFGAAASFDGRPNNVAAYISPTVNGLHAAVAYVAGAELATVSGQDKGNALSAMGMYNNGPLMASLAYERHNFGTAGTGTIAGTANTKEDAWKLGVGYNFGALDVGFAYERTTDNIPAGTATKTYSHNAWNLGGKYKMGSNDLKLAYIKAGDRADVSNTGANQWALGVDHHMSKRTKVFAQYVRLNNDNGATYGLNGAAATGAVNANGAGADPSAWSFGIRHLF